MLFLSTLSEQIDRFLLCTFQCNFWKDLFWGSCPVVFINMYMFEKGITTRYRVKKFNINIRNVFFTAFLYNKNYIYIYPHNH